MIDPLYIREQNLKSILYASVWDVQYIHKNKILNPTPFKPSPYLDSVNKATRLVIMAHLMNLKALITFPVY